MIYLFFILSVYLFFFYVNLRVFGKSIRINFIFNTFWFVCIVYHLLNFNNYYEVSEIVNIYSILVIIIYNLVYYLFSCKNKKIKTHYFDLELEKICNSKLLLFFNILSYIFIIPIMNKSINIILTAGFDRLRIYAFDSTMGLGSTMQLMIIQYVLNPVYSITLMIAAICIVEKVKIKKIYFFAVTDLIIYVLTNGGRVIIFEALIYLIAAILIVNSGKIMLFLKRRKKIVIFFALAIFLSSFLVSQRKMENLNIIQNIAAYYSGCFNYLTQCINHGIINIASAPLKLIFGFIIEPIQIILLFLGFPIQTVNQVVTSPLSQSLVISSSGNTYNALATMMATFLIDSGVCGLFIGTIVFSTYCSLSEKMYLRKNNIRGLLIYMFAIYNIFCSVQKYPLLSSKFTVTILLILILTNKINIKLS